MPVLALPSTGRWIDSLRYGGPDEPLLRAARPSPADGPALHATAERPVNPARESHRPGNDPFLRMQRRLQSLGVSYMRLEQPQPPDGPYRFECQAPLNGHSAYRRRFESEARDPLAAMENVVKQVESWRLGSASP
jgi:hypothetical protein